MYECWPTDPGKPRPLFDFEVLPDRVCSSLFLSFLCGFSSPGHFVPHPHLQSLFLHRFPLPSTAITQLTTRFFSTDRDPRTLVALRSLAAPRPPHPLVRHLDAHVPASLPPLGHTAPLPRLETAHTIFHTELAYGAATGGDERCHSEGAFAGAGEGEYD